MRAWAVSVNYKSKYDGYNNINSDNHHNIKKAYFKVKPNICYDNKKSITLKSWDTFLHKWLSHEESFFELHNVSCVLLTQGFMWTVNNKNQKHTWNKWSIK